VCVLFIFLAMYATTAVSVSASFTQYSPPLSLKQTNKQTNKQKTNARDAGTRHILAFVGDRWVFTAAHAVCRRWRDQCRFVPVQIRDRYVAAPPPFVNSDYVPLCSTVFYYVLLVSLIVQVAPPPLVNSTRSPTTSCKQHTQPHRHVRTAHAAPPAFVNSVSVPSCSTL
jgi:hypothetical protein